MRILVENLPLFRSSLTRDRIIVVGDGSNPALAWDVVTASATATTAGMTFRKMIPDLNIDVVVGADMQTCSTGPIQLDKKHMAIGIGGFSDDVGDLPPLRLLVVNMETNRVEKKLSGATCGGEELILSMASTATTTATDKTIVLTGDSDSTVTIYADHLLSSSEAESEEEEEELECVGLDGPVTGLAQLSWNTDLFAAKVPENSSVDFIDLNEVDVVKTVSDSRFAPCGYHLAVLDEKKVILTCCGSESASSYVVRGFSERDSDAQDSFSLSGEGSHKSPFDVCLVGRKGGSGTTGEKTLAVCCDLAGHVSVHDIRMASGSSSSSLIREFTLRPGEEKPESCGVVSLVEDGDSSVLGVILGSKFVAWKINDGKILSSVDTTEGMKNAADVSIFRGSRVAEEREEEEGETTTGVPMEMFFDQRVEPFLGQESKNPLLDFEIRCGGRGEGEEKTMIFRCPKSLLALNPKLMEEESSNSTELENVAIEDVKKLPPDTFVSLLLGFDEIDVPVDALFPLYVLFKELGLKKQAYLICRAVSELKKPLALIHLALLSKEKYEEERKDRGEETTGNFESAFSLACYNAFQPLSDSFGTAASAICQQYDLLDKIQKHEPVPLFHHPEFAFPADDIPDSFRAVAAQTFAKLYECNRPHSDLVVSLEAAFLDEGRFNVHSAVLRTTSAFFSSVLKFPGTESARVASGKPFVVSREENLCAESVEALIEFLYTGQTSTKEMIPMIQLLLHAHKWGEPKLFREMDRRIREETAFMHQFGTFKGKLKNFGFLLMHKEEEEEPIHPALQKLRQYWTDEEEFVSEDLYEKTVSQSWEGRKFRVLESRLLLLGERMLKLEASVESRVLEMGQRIEVVEGLAKKLQQ